MDASAKTPKHLVKKILIPAIFVVVIIGALIAFLILQMPKNSKTNNQVKVSTVSSSQNETSAATEVSWSWSGQAWMASDTPPTCSVPLISNLPVDITKVTSILYPGQTRGGNYKPHGGFRFGSDNSITVTAPLESQLVEGSRYIEGGETQYLFTFINSCGIAYRFDHLNILSEKFLSIADQLPEAKQDDSRTTPFNPPIKIDQGQVVATKVGFIKTSNVSLDFGVYDLRHTNEASKNQTFVSNHEMDKQFALYGVCWLKELPSEVSQKILSLPAADQANGKTSDYCK